MRDYIFMSLFLGSLPIWFVRPHLGVIAYVGLSLLNPHRHLYEFYDFRFVFIVGIVTLAGMAVVQWPRIPRSRLAALLVLWLAYTAVTSMVAFYPDQAWSEWQQLAKSVLMSLLAMGMLGERKHLSLLILVMAVSIGFYGVKAGAFSLATGGQHRVYGPDDTFIADNNALALAELMVLPLLVFLARIQKRGALKRVSWGSVALVVIAILFSYSRGALLGLMATLGLLAWRLRARERLGVLAVAGCALAISVVVAPDKWFDRVGTIGEDYQADSSLMGRFNAWWFAYNVASTNLLGGGFGAFTRAQFARYAPDPVDFHDSHSIYFEVLGEHGFIGLLLFLGLLAYAVRVLNRVARSGRETAEQRWATDLAVALKVSLVGYGVTGAFLGLAYFDLLYYILAAVGVLERIVKQESLERVAEAERVPDRLGHAVVVTGDR